MEVCLRNCISLASAGWEFKSISFSLEVIGDIPHCTVAWTLPCCGQHWIFISRHCGNSPDRIKTNTPRHGEPLGYTTHMYNKQRVTWYLTYCIQVEVEVECRIRGAIVDLRTRWLSSKCLQSARAIFHYLATSQWSFIWMSVCLNVCFSVSVIKTLC